MIYFATANRGKYETVSAVLAEAGVEAERVDLELAEPRSTDVAAVASAKVLEAWEKLRRPCICVDSGFFIPALGGFPAAYVNFVLGTIGTAGIMRLLEGKPRACEFRNGLAYFDGDREAPLVFVSPVPGRAAEAPAPDLPDRAWSDLYRIFIPDGETLTLAAMSGDGYRRWSRKINRDSCFARFAAWLTGASGGER